MYENLLIDVLAFTVWLLISPLMSNMLDNNLIKLKYCKIFLQSLQIIFLPNIMDIDYCYIIMLIPGIPMIKPYSSPFRLWQLEPQYGGFPSVVHLLCPLWNSLKPHSSE